MIGRLWIWGMSHGYEGCLHVVKSLLADFDITMTGKLSFVARGRKHFGFFLTVLSLHCSCRLPYSS